MAAALLGAGVRLDSASTFVIPRSPEGASRRTHAVAAWTYVLRCSDGSYYVGCTTDLDQRFGQHLAGEIDGYTASRMPVEMVWAEEFQQITDAIAVERQMKGWSRAKKEALMRGDWNRLRALASRASRRSPAEPSSA